MSFILTLTTGHYAFARLSKTPTVSTMHGRLDLEDLKPIYARYKTMPLVSISDGQRAPVPFMNWVSTIHHGLPRDLLTYSKGPGKYLAFLGRISPEKRPDLAIDIARKAGIPVGKLRGEGRRCRPCLLRSGHRKYV